MLSYNSGIKAIKFDSEKILERVVQDKEFSFAKYTTYGLGGGARAAFFPKNMIEARAVYDYAKKSGEPWVILANGSNILASDKYFDGFVICTKYLQGIVRIDKNTIFCLSGTTVSQVLNYCISHGLGCLEYLAGIPASIGGIACMNGGAGGRYINSNVLSVKLYDGMDCNLSNQNCKYTYKHSTMRDINSLILGVFLSALTDFPINVRKRIMEYSLMRVRLPKGRSCGCVFKNPDIPLKGGMVSAGRIIQDCGLAGYGSPRAYVSPEHCNFIINNGSSANEIYNLIQNVKSIVLEKCGVELDEEVVYIGDFS